MSIALLPASTNSPTLSRPLHVARKRALYQATVLENPWVPDEIKAGLFPKQVESVCYEAREMLYGGAIDGCKSVVASVRATVEAIKGVYKHALRTKAPALFVAKPWHHPGID